MGLKQKINKSKVADKVKQVKKPEKDKSSIRKDNSKRTAFFVWTLIVGMLFIATLSILLSVNTRSTLNDTNRSLLAMEGEEEQEEISQETANEFLSNFIREYINVPLESEDREERANNLQEYMVYNERFNNDNNAMYSPEGDGTRNLQSFNLFNVEENELNTIYQYKVTFTNASDSDDESEDQTLLLNIPIVVEDGLFSIPTTPYFTDVPSLAGNIEYEEESIDLEEYNGNEKKDLIVFLNTFFERYTTEPIEEMSYLMEEPESLNGSFLFEEIQDVNIYQDSEGYKVLLQVIFKDETSGITQTNAVEMDITKNGSNFYVEKFNYK